VRPSVPIVDRAALQGASRSMAPLRLVAVAVLAAARLVLAEEVGNPVGKVVALLTEMKNQVTADAAADETAYEKYMCWCTTTEKEKVAAIEFATSEIQRLTTLLEEGEAKEAELKTTIAALKSEIADDQDALSTATALRRDEHDKFLAEEEDMKETRGLLKEAVTVLSKVQLVQEKGAGREAVAAEARRAAEALVQVRRKASLRKNPKFRNVMQQDLYDVLGSLSDLASARGSKIRGDSHAQAQGAAVTLAQRRLLPWEKTDEQIGAEAKPNELIGAASGAKSYNARSGRILGILSEMHDEFSRDLGLAQYDEYMALVSFQKLRSAKISEIYIATETKKRKEVELAELLQAMAQAKEQREEMAAAKEADETFLAQMREGCQKEDEEYKKRFAVRSEELRALSEALKILTEEEARATFSRSTLSLLQETAERSSRRAASSAQELASQRAMERIAKVARAHKNWAMLSLAVRVRLDSFTKVIEMMDKMTAELKKQQQEEYEKHEFCKKEIDETEDLIKVHTNTKETLDERHLALTDKLASLAKDIDTLKKEVADMEVSLKDAGEQRKAENALYQQSVMDQRATINILNKALDRLKMFYSKEALVQTRQGQPVPGAAAPPPPPKGEAYESSAGAGGVLQLMMKIITDAEEEEKVLDVSENAAQSRYAEFVTGATASIEADRSAIQDNEKLVAATESEKAEVEEAQLGNDAELDRLGKLLKAHHLDCDFLLKYFDLRQKYRAEELDSIADAKAILSGADFGK